MWDPTGLLQSAPPWVQPGLVGALCGAVALTIPTAALRTRSKRSRNASSGRSLERFLTVVAALIATGVALQGMWRLFDVLDMHPWLRWSLVGFLEIAMAVSAIRARRNLLMWGSAGVDGVAVWAFASATLATLEAHSAAEHLLRILAPFAATWLWHRGMVGEYREARGLDTSSISWRLTPSES